MEREVIGIDVNDESFQRFKRSFDDYFEKVGQSSEQWKKFSQAMGGASDTMAAFASAMTNELKGAVLQQRTLEGATRRSDHAMKRLAHSTGSVAHNIMKMTKFAAALGGISGIFAGLAIPALGRAAGNRFQSAAQLWMTPGQMGAWNAQMGPLGVGSGFLHDIAQAQMNPVQSAMLAKLTGQSIQQIQHESVTTLAKSAITALRPIGERYRHFGGQTQRMLMKSLPWLGMIPGAIPAAQMLGAYNASTVARHLSLATSKREIQKFQFSANTAAQWAKFESQLKTAGGYIEKDLIQKLGFLAPRLGSLAGVISTDLVKAIDWALTAQHLKEFSRGLSEAVHFLGSKQFMGEVKSFVHAVGDMTHAVVWSAKKMGAVYKPVHHEISGMLGNPFIKRLELFDPALWILNELFGTNKKDTAAVTRQQATISSDWGRYVQSHLPQNPFQANWNTGMFSLRDTNTHLKKLNDTLSRAHAPPAFKSQPSNVGSNHALAAFAVAPQ